MRTTFYCENCSKPLPADERLSGRVVTCPFCRQATTLRSGGTATVAASATTAAETTATRTSESEEPVATEDSGFDVESASGDGTTSVFDKEIEAVFLERCPNFAPNPFAIYFPLNETNPPQREEDPEERDFEEESESSPYDVEELIKGVEKPDGGF